MSEIPLWWLILSGIGFAMSILLNIALLIGGIVAWGKIGPVLIEARDQLRRIGDQTSHITSTVKSTVDTVHDRTEQILGTAQEASARTTRLVGTASAALTAVFIVMRLVGFMRGLFAHKPERREIPAALP